LKQVVLYGLIFLVSSLAAQIKAPFMINYTTNDYGVYSTPEVWSIAEDDGGIMYFGLSNEIAQFDGVNWKLIAAGKKNISALKYHNDVLYFGSYNQFGMIAISDSNFQVSKVLSTDVPFNFANVWRIETLDQFVYFQTEEALFVYDSETNKVEVVKPKTSFHIMFSVNDKLYIRQRNIGLMQIEGLELKLVNDDYLLQEFGFFEAFSMPDKSVFLLTNELGFRQVSENLTGKLVDPCENNCHYLVNSGIIGGARVKENLIALNSTTDGCYFSDDDGHFLGQISIENGLNSNEIKDVHVDRNGKLWLATGAGITKVEVLQPFQYFDSDFGIEGNVQSYGMFRGKRFIGTSIGLGIETDSNSLNFELYPHIHKQVFDVLNLKDEILFIATDEGLYTSLDGEEFTLFQEGSFHKLYYDETNQFLITAGKNGIIIYDAGYGWSIFSTYLFKGANITHIVYDQKNNCHWIGSQSGGVVQCEFDGFDFIYTRFGHVEGDGLNPNTMISPFRYKNSVAFGTPTDILHFVNEEEIIEEMKESGIWNDTMIEYPMFYGGEFMRTHELYFDDDHALNFQSILDLGEIIVGVVDNELGYYKGEDFITKPFKSFDVGRINFIHPENEYLWVGSINGLTKVNLLDVINSTVSDYQVSVNFRQIVYNDSVEMGTYGVFKHECAIPYQRNKIVFDFASATIHNDKSPQYNWRLVGDDDNWSRWSFSKHREFKNLHEGDYILEIKAKDVFGNESEVKQFRFTVEKPWYRTIWAYLLYVVAFLAIVYLAIIIGQKRLKAQNIRLEGIVEERTTEIQKKNDALEHSYTEIAEQKQEITDSINYAQRIQEAILPLSEDIANHIAEYFVLFRPKDIVSGDFYWFAHRDNHSIFVCADCTGHGVPGAFMSMVGSDKLNQAVLEKGNTNPAKILSIVNRGIKKALKQNELEDDATRDGMDAAIVSIDWERNILKFSGAHNGLYLIRDNELVDYKATKVAIAGFTPMDQEFNLTEIEIKKGDCFYMTTDGYPDQFGGPRGKKLKTKILKNYLIEIHKKPMGEQQKMLSQNIIDWMGDEHEQIDDICIVGIKI